MGFTTQGREIRLIEAVRQEELTPFPGIPCPSCGDDLLVSTYQDSFLLICRCGRQLQPEDSLGDPSPDVAAGLEALLAVWEDRLDSLRALSADARAKGFPNISVVMDRHIQNHRARIERLQRIVKPSSARLLPE